MNKLLILLALISILIVAKVEAKSPSLKKRAYAYCSCRGGVRTWDHKENVDSFILVCNNGDYVLGHSGVKKVKFRPCTYVQE